MRVRVGARVGVRVRVPVALVCLDDAALVDAAALLDDVGAEDLGVGVREEVVPHLERGAVLVRGRGLGLGLLLLQSCALQSHLLQSD